MLLKLTKTALLILFCTQVLFAQDESSVVYSGSDRQHKLIQVSLGIYEIDTKKGDEVLLNTAKVYPGADERTPSYSQYFSWINNTNEGSTEE
jgi:hypothetical protein